MKEQVPWLLTLIINRDVTLGVGAGGNMKTWYYLCNFLVNLKSLQTAIFHLKSLLLNIPFILSLDCHDIFVRHFFLCILMINFEYSS